MKTILLNIPMVPKGKKRASFRKFKNGVSVAYNSTEDKNFEKIFSDHVSEYILEKISSVIIIDIVAIFPRPEKMEQCYKNGIPKIEDGYLPYGNIPDKDNIEKIIYDAMKRYMQNDKLIVAGDCVKAYGSIGEMGSVWVKIMQLEKGNRNDKKMFLDRMAKIIGVENFKNKGVLHE